MTRRSWLILLVSLVFFSGCGKAIYSVKKEVVPTKITVKQMKSAIISAANERGWTVKNVSDGVIHTTYYRGKYMAKLEVTYSASTYSINYLKSKNLKYDGQKIHGTYNKWVKNLENTIDRKLDILSDGGSVATATTKNNLASLGFVTGKTTKDDVMEKLGGPTSVTHGSNGEETLTYNRSHLTGKAWIPFYFGRDTYKVEYFVLTFKDNILTSFSESH